MAKTSITPQIQADFTNEVLQQFAQGLDKVLRERLRAISGKAPHQTIQNLRYHIIQANASNISAQWHLYFQDSGRHSEMKKLKGGKILPVAAILDWIKRGREKDFRLVPGYTHESRLSKAKQLQRIAWAIAITKAKGTIRKARERKERAWVNRNVHLTLFGIGIDMILKYLLDGAIGELPIVGFDDFSNVEILDWVLIRSQMRKLPRTESNSAFFNAALNPLPNHQYFPWTALSALLQSSGLYHTLGSHRVSVCVHIFRT